MQHQRHGRLAIQLYNATPEEDLDLQRPVQVSLDGVAHTYPPGSVVRLQPGESISLPQRLYHKFWGEERVLVGEVSLVNDDSRDNASMKPSGCFPVIEEDEPPLHLLCNDYERYYHIQDGR